ncbi:hypothetical protein PLESTB_001223500 [Pleodorina starrii]|uniref:Uncharacterized protein n=1 Tax=Pleodorina starrii TaxID=330485 RepID=A0A9W6BT14_9CHLO|nr:hypothetical protein PLESTB_001223500 [Pleodorina starrii]GLC77066.1 hypothetical protein PLESTF_001879600 [Pleodorina starrii]
MGIPKFYRWLSERYPLLNQKLTLTEGPPEIDNLYLDMNGIIHNCTHANRKDIGGVTEEDMMLKVFDYLEKLIQIVRPQKLLFMAIDGVAPRAKMNQQRSRRFKSAMERLKNEEEQRRKGEPVPDDPFDSNCITPGTEFMARLGKHLRFFIRRKMAEDPLWQKPTVVFSGHEVPGEGEHKIMEYIRWEKRQPSYQPNQRHCMYGLDADLVMLSLVSHEPHFCLLREVVSYTGQGRGQPAREVLENPCAENFILFQIGLLREYFELEFGNIKLPFPLDLERIVDDYVLMCMLVGNDFLPALPTLDIAEGALNKLMDMYKEVLPSLGGYLTYAGDLDRRRLEVLLERIGQMELQVLEERAQDAEFMESKRAKRAARMGGGQRSQLDEIDAGMRSLAVGGPPGSRGNLLNQALEPGPGPGAAQQQQQQGPTMMSREARQMMMAGLGDQGLQMWKDRYYSEKLHAYGSEDRRTVAEHYIAGLHWVLEYYYRGVASWDWYYPYHYAPMASDMVNLDVIQVAFAQGSPFRPFEQLLAVLPAASSKLLPPPFRVLMMDPESPIIDFYPASFEVDMEGKRADWEGVVLVPFVDEIRLLEAARSVKAAVLSPEEQARNQLGKIQIFQFSRNASEPNYCASTMPKHFKDLKVCHSRCLERPPPPPLPPGGKGFVPALVPGTRVGLLTPVGMPTLKSLQVRPSLRNVGVNVLGMPSRKESLVLAFKDLREALNGAVLSAEQVANSGLLGSRAYINWPYLQEARVVRVSDRGGQVSYDSKGAVKVQRWQQPEGQRWETDAVHLANTFLTRCGIDVGKVDLVVGVKVCLGYIRHSDGTIEKTYSKDEVQVPLQAVIRQRPQQLAAGGGAQVADDVPGFPTLDDGMQVVFLGKHFFGCMATVLPDLGKGLSKHGKLSKQGAAAANGHYRVLVQPVSDQVGIQALRSAKRVIERFAVKYYNSGEVSNKAGVSPRLLGRITGNMWTRDGDDRYDLGLAIKTSSKDVCVPGFSQPTEDGNGWTYSAAVINILQEYRKTFPWLWAALLKSEGEGAGDLRLDQLLPGLTPAQRKDKVREVTDWIKSTPLAKRPLVKLGTQVLSDEGVKALQSIVAPMPAHPPPPTEYENVPPLLLLPPYTPGADQVKLAVQGGPLQLGDRVVCVSGKGTPPYGLRGTVIGVYEEACEVLFDEEFGGGSNLNGRANGKCGAFVPLDLLLCVNKPIEISLAKHQVPRQSSTHAADAASASPGNANGARNGQGAALASRAAQKATQQPSPPGAAAKPCVPASVAVTAPVSPPVPSTKLLGAAMRAAGAVKQGEVSRGADAGSALLQKLTAGNQGRSPATPQPYAEDDVALRAAAAAAAALASAPATQPVPAGSLAQLQKLVPNARVGSAGPSPQVPPQNASRPASVRGQRQEQQNAAPPFSPPPLVQQPYPPQPMFVHGGMAPPPPMQQQPGIFQPGAPYVTGPPPPHQPAFFFPPHAPAPLNGGMRMPGPFPGSVVMAPPPMPMMGPMRPGQYHIPYAAAPLPPQPAFSQPPPQQHPMLSMPAPSQVSTGANSTGSTSVTAVPAPESHPIDVDAMQSIDDGDEAVAGLIRGRAEGTAGRAAATAEAPQRPPSKGTGLAPQYAAAQQSGAGAPARRKSAGQVVAGSARASGSGADDEGRSAGGGAAFGKSARLPDASGRGFKGRGRPISVQGAPGPVAPGSQAAASGVQPPTAPTQLLAARHSLDCGGGASAVPMAAAAPPPPNPGAALLRKLQGSAVGNDADAAAKAQSLDSGTELLRALRKNASGIERS